MMGGLFFMGNGVKTLKNKALCSQSVNTPGVHWRATMCGHVQWAFSMFLADTTTRRPDPKRRVAGDLDAVFAGDHWDKARA